MAMTRNIKSWLSKHRIQKLQSKLKANLEIRIQGEPCLEWTGAKHSVGGYGRIIIHNSEWLAHRVFWRISFGKIPRGLDVLHHCDNPPCVNVKHLWLGTQAENTRDAQQKGRIRTNPSFGEEHQNATISNTVVRAIKRFHQEGLSSSEISKLIGVNARYVRKITAGKARRFT